jgi:hypothetical protein
MDDDAEEYRPGAGGEGWESTCEEVGEGAAAEESETSTGAEGTGRASGIGACAVGDEVAADDDVRMEAATDDASGGAGTLPTPVLGMMAAGPSARVRPRVTAGGGGKTGDHNGDTGEGEERATLSACGERTATDEAGEYEFRKYRSRTS